MNGSALLMTARALLMLAVVACSGDSSVSTQPLVANGESIERVSATLTPGSGTWEYLGYTPIHMRFAAAAPLGGNLYIVGGSQYSHVVNRALEYDAVLGGWNRDVAKMPAARAHAVAARYQGKVLVMGGVDTTWTRT